MLQFACVWFSLPSRWSDRSSFAPTTGSSSATTGAFLLPAQHNPRGLISGHEKDLLTLPCHRVRRPPPLKGPKDKVRLTFTDPTRPTGACFSVAQEKAPRGGGEGLKGLKSAGQ